MTSSLFTYACLSSSSKELAYIYPPNEVLVGYFNIYIYHLFSATTNERGHIILVIVEPPIL